MADRIELKGLTFHANHGVLTHETEHGQAFSLDITCWLEFAEAAATDDLTTTVNYAELAQVAHDIATGTPRQLIETVARLSWRRLSQPLVISSQHEEYASSRDK